MSEGHFEAKVERRSENKAGIFITFLVQPDDHDTALAQLRVGASVQIGWAEIVDTSVQKIEVGPVPASGVEASRDTARAVELEAAVAVCPRAVEDSGKSTKPRQRFSDLKPSAQAGMRCGELSFVNYIATTYPHTLDELGRDVAAFVREYCGVTSRAQLNDNENAAFHWNSLESEHQKWLTTQQHAELIR